MRPSFLSFGSLWNLEFDSQQIQVKEQELPGLFLFRNVKNRLAKFFFLDVVFVLEEKRAESFTDFIDIIFVTGGTDDVKWLGKYVALEFVIFDFLKISGHYGFLFCQYVRKVRNDFSEGIFENLSLDSEKASTIHEVKVDWDVEDIILSHEIPVKVDESVHSDEIWVLRHDGQKYT